MNTQEENKIYLFPPLNLLKIGECKNFDRALIKETALIIQQTLQNFGARVVITDINVGTRFTRYEIQPEQGVRVKAITSRENEIRIAVGAKSIHIEAPIPGKCAIGIDIPNTCNTVATIREIIESDAFQNFPSNLAFAAGKDITGNVVVSDIATMRHLLIAGTTGSGKTTCIDAIVMSILYKANPVDVKLVMIDTKVVNMSVYNGIPHLLIPVVTDTKRACAALNWCITEMNDRYYKFADIGTRDLRGYNRAAESGKLDLFGEPIKRLPQILVIIDDLYDMITSSPKEVQDSITRLTQSSSATGIHLVISTQRPSTDVIAGLIKANIPSCIAFSTVSAIDSRVILDESGAEKLLGNGDMLFKPIGYQRPLRVQGAYVSEPEISDVVDFLRNQTLSNKYDSSALNKTNTMYSKLNYNIKIDELDPYFREAGKFVIEKGKASIGMIQRVFKIGFNRAARIVDQLEEIGVVGADEGTKPRRILMTMEEFEEKFCNSVEPKTKESEIIKEKATSVGQKCSKTENVAESKTVEEIRQKDINSAEQNIKEDDFWKFIRAIFRK